MAEQTTICRACWARGRELVEHPIGIFSGKSICQKCLGIYQTPDYDWEREEDLYDQYCRICGEGDLLLYYCCVENCRKGFCGGCISGNCGVEQYRKIVDDSSDTHSWECFVCNVDSRKAFLDTPDMEYRGMLGGFSPRSFFPVSACDPRPNPLEGRIRLNPTKPYRVISVCWFFRDLAFSDETDEKQKLENPFLGTKYLMGLFANIDALTKYFPDWVMRIYYDETVVKALPFLAPFLLRAFARHPQIELHEFPHWVEFKHMNGIYVNLIPCLFRLLPLEEPGIDAVVFRDLDSVLTEADAKYVNEWLDGGKPLHRYYSKIYKWSLLAGAFGMRATVPGSPIVPGIRALMYAYLCKHYRNPDEIAPVLAAYRGETEEEMVDHRDLPGRYYVDQVFLEQKILPKFNESDIVTTKMCIENCHADYNERSRSVHPKCKHCNVASFEYIMSPTYMPPFMEKYNRARKGCLQNMKAYLKRFEWAKKYLLDQPIVWAAKQVNDEISAQEEATPPHHAASPLRASNCQSMYSRYSGNPGFSGPRAKKGVKRGGKKRSRSKSVPNRPKPVRLRAPPPVPVMSEESSTESEEEEEISPILSRSSQPAQRSRSPPSSSSDDLVCLGEQWGTPPPIKRRLRQRDKPCYRSRKNPTLDSNHSASSTQSHSSKGLIVSDSKKFQKSSKSSKIPKSREQEGYVSLRKRSSSSTLPNQRENTKPKRANISLKTKTENQTSKKKRRRVNRPDRNANPNIMSVTSFSQPTLSVKPSIQMDNNMIILSDSDTEPKLQVVGGFKSELQVVNDSKSGEITVTVQRRVGRPRKYEGIPGERSSARLQNKSHVPSVPSVSSQRRDPPRPKPTKTARKQVSSRKYSTEIANRKRSAPQQTDDSRRLNTPTSSIRFSHGSIMQPRNADATLLMSMASAVSHAPTGPRKSTLTGAILGEGSGNSQNAMPNGGRVNVLVGKVKKPVLRGLVKSIGNQRNENRPPRRKIQPVNGSNRSSMRRQKLAPLSISTKTARNTSKDPQNSNNKITLNPSRS
eukprot:432179_1